MQQPEAIWAINMELLRGRERAFIEKGAEMMQSYGRASELHRWINIADADVMRFLLGVEGSWLTTARRRFAEVTFYMVRNEPINPAGNIWCNTPGWFPRNPRSDFSDPAEAVLDIEFIKQLGVRPASFCDAVLRSQSLHNRARYQGMSEGDIARAFLALGMFGFPEPQQFFCRRED